jgi:hypothetical protein
MPARAVQMPVEIALLCESCFRPTSLWFAQPDPRHKSGRQRIETDTLPPKSWPAVRCQSQRRVAPPEMAARVPRMRTRRPCAICAHGATLIATSKAMNIVRLLRHDDTRRDGRRSATLRSGCDGISSMYNETLWLAVWRIAAGD